MVILKSAQFSLVQIYTENLEHDGKSIKEKHNDSNAASKLDSFGRVALALVDYLKRPKMIAKQQIAEKSFCVI